MPTLLTFGLIGAGAIATSMLLRNMSAKAPDGVARFGAFDARPILAGLGLLGTVLLPGLGSLLAAAVGAGAVLNMVAPAQSMVSGIPYPQVGGQPFPHPQP